MNPYDVLEVSSDATVAEIKAAYRQKAHRLHPDKGGGVEEFQQLQSAYRILISPEKKAKYDRTGDTDQGPDPLLAALEQLSSMFMQVVEQTANVDSSDIIGIVKRAIAGKMHGIVQQRAAVRANVDKYNKVIKRLSRRSKGRPDIMQRVLKDKIRALEGEASNLDVAEKLGYDMLELLNDYDYKFELNPTASYQGIMFAQIQDPSNWSPRR